MSVSALQLRKLLCVIDPTTQNQRALVRAASVAAGARAVVHAYLCFALPANASYQDADEMREAEVARYRLWLDALVAPAKGHSNHHGDRVSERLARRPCRGGWPGGG